jgi:F0F1-type ATP synthase membrane subunit c/vacuolar-type H+-ATPase subunit K
MANPNIQYGIVIGTAIAGLSTLLTTYDAITKINVSYLECEQNNPDLQKSINSKFITVLVIAITAIVIGIIIKYLLHKNIIASGFILAGILGIAYAIAMKLQYLSDTAKVTTSWIAFIALIIVGVLYDRSYATSIAAIPVTNVTEFTN